MWRGGRVALGAVLVVLAVASAIAGARTPVDKISFWFSGTAYQVADSYATTVALGYHLANRETTVVTFETSCTYYVEAARVRPGEPLLCDTGKWATVLGRIENEDPTDPAHNCTAAIRFRPGVPFNIGGTLETPKVLQANTGAPFTPSQLVITNINPLEEACSGLPLESPGGSETFSVDKPMPFPDGTAENPWSDDLGTTSAPVHVMFSAELTLETGHYELVANYERWLDAIRNQLGQWWNAALNAAAGAIPPKFTVEVPGVGTVHATFTPAASAGHGPLERTAHAAADALFTVDQPVHAGLNALRPRVTPLGRAVLADRASAPALHSTLTFVPAGRGPVTVTGTFTPLVVPAISSAQFSGTPQNPTIVVRGRGLAPLPPQSPSGTPAGHNGCPAQSGDYGFDYGSQLNINDLSKGWSAGLSYANNTSCIGLVPTRVTPTELDLRLGSFYTSLYPKFALANGDELQVVANGAPIDVHVSYGAPVTR